MVESAIGIPASMFGGAYLHPTLPDMAAAYLFHLVNDHPFLDGNKRVGTMSALVFLELNDFDFDAFMNEHAPQQAAAQPEEATGTPIDARSWTQIVLGTEKRFPPLIGQLTDSEAYIVGGAIHIRLGEAKLKSFINPTILSQYVSEAALETLGKQYNIKVE